MAASTCIECDVAIVGSGFAGSLIANELRRSGIKVVILEAGPGVPPNTGGCNGDPSMTPVGGAGAVADDRDSPRRHA